MKDVQHRKEDAMTLPTADLISEVLRLDEEATKGPWANKPSEHRLQDGEWRYQDEYGNWTSCIRPDPDSPVENTLAEFWGTEFNDEANAELVTHYRTSAPELARRLRDAEEKLARANEALQKVRVKGIPAGIAVLGRNEDWRERVTEVLDTIDEALAALAPPKPAEKEGA